MTKAIFLFITSGMLLLPFISFIDELSTINQLSICMPFILLLGIPHGAIDNLLFIRNDNIKNANFIIIYLIIIGLNVGLWIALPAVGYILFLILSAYHFGQSQFSHYFKEQCFIHQFFYLIWGITLLSGLVYFNQEEIQLTMKEFDEFAVFALIHQEDLTRYVFFSSLALTLIFMVKFTFNDLLNRETLLMELLVLVLVLSCFYLMPLLIGFTLYFTILHSFKVLKEEYVFLLSEKTVRWVGEFIQLVLPFTLLSFMGIAFLFGLIYFNILTISYGYCLLIVISSITLPHVFVMNRFYKLLFKTNFYQQRKSL